VVTTFLLDTNVVSELARPVPHPVVEARVAESERQAAISSITWHELVFGVARMPSGRRDALTTFVDDLVVRFPVSSWRTGGRAEPCPAVQRESRSAEDLFRLERQTHRRLRRHLLALGAVSSARVSGRMGP
jgi:predicted nucleic acid-binding protein